MKPIINPAHMTGPDGSEEDVFVVTWLAEAGLSYQWFHSSEEAQTFAQAKEAEAKKSEGVNPEAVS